MSIISSQGILVWRVVIMNYPRIVVREIRSFLSFSFPYLVVDFCALFLINWLTINLNKQLDVRKKGQTYSYWGWGVLLLSPFITCNDISEQVGLFWKQFHDVRVIFFPVVLLFLSLCHVCMMKNSPNCLYVSIMPVHTCRSSCKISWIFWTLGRPWRSSSPASFWPPENPLLYSKSRACHIQLSPKTSLNCSEYLLKMFSI